MAYKDYSEAEVGEALIKLAVNKHDIKKTAKEIGISEKTLRRWANDAPKKGIGDLLERAIERMLLHIPTDWRGHDWAVALGILMDKWLLMQGEATARTEAIVTSAQSLTPEERNAVLAEADRILASAGKGGGARQGGSDRLDG